MEKCRACLATEVLMFPLDEDFIYNYNILTSLDVKTYDNMSQVVCETCLQSVKFFVDFREKCIVSETSLRNIKEDVKVERKLNTLENIKLEYDIDCDDSYLDPMDFTNEINMLIKKENVEEMEKVEKQYKRTKWKNAKKMIKHSQESESQLFCGDMDTQIKHHEQPRPEYKHYLSHKSPLALQLAPLPTMLRARLNISLCSKEFLDNSKLVAHLEGHIMSKTCCLCPQILKGWAHLLGHRLMHLPKNQKTCHICSKRFLTGAGLEFHFRKIHLNETNIMLTCDTCSHSFDTPRKLHKHMWSSHSNINYVCDHCGKIYSNKHTLRVHIRTHMEVKLYVCNICDFSCKHSGGLKDHHIRKHIDQKVYCAECKRVFESQEKCDKHRCSTKPPTICTVCGVELKRGLSRHMDTHKTVGRYKCSRCPKAYKARGALEIHMNQHDGNRNLRCEFCPATFYYPSVLGKHRRIHTGEKPYVCKICNRGFTGNNNLKVHMKVHGEHNLIVKKVKPEVIEA